MSLREVNMAKWELQKQKAAELNESNEDEHYVIKLELIYTQSQAFQHFFNHSKNIGGVKEKIVN